MFSLVKNKFSVAGISFFAVCSLSFGMAMMPLYQQQAYYQQQLQGQLAMQGTMGSYPIAGYPTFYQNYVIGHPNYPYGQMGEQHVSTVINIPGQGMVAVPSAPLMNEQLDNYYKTTPGGSVGLQFFEMEKQSKHYQEFLKENEMEAGFYQAD